MKTRTMAFAWLLLATLPLGGCSGEPSEGDIRDALLASIKQLQEGPAGALFEVKLNAVEKLGCEPDGRTRAFVCDVRVDSTTPIGSQTRTQRVRFVEARDGWTAIQTP